MDRHHRIAIIASQYYSNTDEIIEFIENGLGPDEGIITGKHTGLEDLILQTAVSRNIPIRVSAVRYNKYSKFAPIIRNKNIISRARKILVYNVPGDFTISAFLNSVKEMGREEDLTIINDPNPKFLLGRK